MRAVEEVMPNGPFGRKRSVIFSFNSSNAIKIFYVGRWNTHKFLSVPFRSVGPQIQVFSFNYGVLVPIVLVVFG